MEKMSPQKNLILNSLYVIKGGSFYLNCAMVCQNSFQAQRKKYEAKSMLSLEEYKRYWYGRIEEINLNIFLWKFMLKVTKFYHL